MTKLAVVFGKYVAAILATLAVLAAVATAFKMRVQLQVVPETPATTPADPGKGETPGSVVPPPDSLDPIPIGILHSVTGHQGSSEQLAADAAMMAVDEINKAGGVLGRRIKPISTDCQGETTVYTSEAERLLTEQKVVALFGGWRTSSRKAVRAVVEQHNSVLFYPLQYEGLERSPRTVYLGPVPNQVVIPAVDYLVEKQGKRRLFVVGSDYPFPRVSTEVVKDSLRFRKGLAAGGKPAVVGTEFLPLMSRNVGPAVAAIKTAKPDAVLNFLSGPANFEFFKRINAEPETADIPVVSFSLIGSELAALDKTGIAGDYLAGTEFPSAGGDAGRTFMKRFRERYGSDKMFADPMAADYAAVHVWAKAVAAAGTTDPSAVLKAVGGLTFDGPVGTIKIDPDTLHTWLPFRIGRVRPDADLQTVSETDTIRPEPYPAGRTPTEWDQFMSALYVEWGNRWQAPLPDRGRAE